MVVDAPTRRASMRNGAHRLSSAAILAAWATLACGPSRASQDATTHMDASFAGSGGESGGAGAMGASGGTPGNDGAPSGGAAAGGRTAGGGRTSAGGAAGASAKEAGAPPSSALVVVGSGTYSGGQGRLALFRYDYGAETLSPGGTANVGGLQSFAAVDVVHSVIYAGDEVDGTLRRFPFDGAALALGTPTSVQTAGHPVFVTTTRDGAFTLVAHYSEGSVESFPTSSGTPGARVSTASPGAQAHAIVLSPDERFAYVPCKGSDRVARFSFDGATGTLTELSPPVPTAAGDGPRHVALTPDGTRAFVVNELSNTVLAYTVDVASASLTEVDRVSTLPPGPLVTSTGAEVLVSPSGQTVYVTNRLSGRDGDVAAFRVETNGHLTLLGHQSTLGPTPRSAALDPTGRVLFAGNQDGTTVAIVPVDLATGALGAAHAVDVGKGPYFVGTSRLEP